MAIYHFSAQVISRSAGRSSIAASAYRAAEKMVDEKTGLVHDFRKKNGVDYTEILLPTNAPERLKSRAELWREVERVEKRKDAQLAREINVALPVELPHEAQIELAKQFVQDTFVRDGMIADLCVHDLDSENPHFHVMLTTRNVDESGFTTKNRDWNDRELLKKWREKWAEYANAELEKNGFDERIDHRTLEAQNIEREPQIHLGPTRHAMLEKGKSLYSIDEQHLTQIAQRAAAEKIKEAELYSQSESINNELKQLEYELHAERTSELRRRVAATRDALAAEEAAEQRIANQHREIEANVAAEDARQRELESAIAVARAEEQRLANQLRELESAIESEKARKREFGQYLEHTQRELDERRTDASKVQESIARTHNYVQQAQDKQSQFKRELEDAQREYAGARAEYEKAEKRKRTAERRNKDAQRLHEFKRLNFLERRKQIRELEQSVEHTAAELERAKDNEEEIRVSIAFDELTENGSEREISKLEKEIAELERAAQKVLEREEEKPRYEYEHEQDVEIVRAKPRF